MAVGKLGGRRTLFLVCALAVVVGAAVADGEFNRPGPSQLAPGAGASSAGTLTLASGSLSPGVGGAESTAWYCVGGAAQNNISVVIQITNPNTRSVSGTVSAITATGTTKSEQVSLPPGSDDVLSDVQPVAGAAVGVTVLVDGGGVGVSELVSGAQGWSASPCASDTSSVWDFAHGNTASGADVSLLLYNPGATDAVVNTSFDSSTSGTVTPPPFQGVSVPAGSLVTEDVGNYVLGDPSFATELQTTSGAVVAGELVTEPGTGGGGDSMMLGSPGPASRWDFPQNVEPSGGQLTFFVLNPTSSTVQVKVGTALEQGQAEPLSLEVGAHSVGQLVAEHVARFPPSGTFATSFTSTGAGIVVSREVSAASSAPAPQIGQVSGSPGESSSYVLPAPQAPASQLLSLGISCSTSRTSTVTLRLISPAAHDPVLLRRTVVPGQLLVVAPGALEALGSGPMEVQASTPVAVELDAGPVGAQGVAVLPALATG